MHIMPIYYNKSVENVGHNGFSLSIFSYRQDVRKTSGDIILYMYVLDTLSDVNGIFLCFETVKNDGCHCSPLVHHVYIMCTCTFSRGPIKAYST